MSKIIKPFGRPMMEIHLIFDDKGTLQLSGWQMAASPTGPVKVPLHPLQICVLLSGTVEKSLKAFIESQTKPQGLAPDNGTKNTNNH